MQFTYVGSVSVSVKVQKRESTKRQTAQREKMKQNNKATASLTHLCNTECIGAMTLLQAPQFVPTSPK